MYKVKVISEPTKAL